ncbi:hypothetical protein D3C76_1449370 [compost metagenome]
MILKEIFQRTEIVLIRVQLPAIGLTILVGTLPMRQVKLVLQLNSTVAPVFACQMV